MLNSYHGQIDNLMLRWPAWRPEMTQETKQTACSVMVTKVEMEIEIKSPFWSVTNIILGRPFVGH